MIYTRITGLWILLIANFALPAQTTVKDSLLGMLKTGQSDTGFVKTTTRLVNVYLKEKNIDVADSMINIAERFIKKKEIAYPYELKWAKAELYFNKKQYDKGIDEMMEVINMLEYNKNNQKLAMARNFLGYLYLNTGKFSESLDVYHKNLTFAKSNNLKNVLPGTYSGLAYVYKNLGNIEEERKYLLLMAGNSINEGKKRAAAEAYLRLGDIGMESDSNFTYAIGQYQKSLRIFRQLQDSGSTAFLLLRIGWNHYLDDRLDSALVYFFNSLNYSLPIERLTAITNAYGNIGTIYRDKKEYNKAIQYYRKSIEYSLKAKDWYNLSWLYKDMSLMNVSQGDYKSAYQNQVLHKKYSDSLETQKANLRLAEARTMYEAEKAEKDLQLVTFRLKQHTYLTYGFGGLILLVLVIGFMLFRQTRMNAERKISEMNHKISEITQKNLRQQMNPHFIFNTLNSIQYYMYQHDKISTNNYLTKFSMLMRKTLENSQYTAIPIKDELDALELYLELEALRFKEKFEYKIEVDEDIDQLLYKIPTMLIQPFVENAILHGLINKEGKGSLHIGLKLDHGQVSCTIEDNGIGRKAAAKLNETKNRNHNSLGTKITESRLKLANTLYGKNMKLEYSDLKDEDGKPTGTRVTIYIPVMIREVPGFAVDVTQN